MRRKIRSRKKEEDSIVEGTGWAFAMLFGGGYLFLLLMGAYYNLIY